jgi:hypothetical protein
MKVRNGFVSNSSSSSFVLGYGKVLDQDALEQYLWDNDLEIDDYYLKMWDDDYDAKYSTQYDLSCTNTTVVTIPENLRCKGTIIAEFGNDEGDGEFTNYEGDYDLDWEKADSIDYYDQDQQAVIKLFSQPFIENGYVRIGAERNG